MIEKTEKKLRKKSLISPKILSFNFGLYRNKIIETKQTQNRSSLGRGFTIRKHTSRWFGVYD